MIFLVHVVAIVCIYIYRKYTISSLLDIKQIPCSKIGTKKQHLCPLCPLLAHRPGCFAHIQHPRWLRTWLVPMACPRMNQKALQQLQENQARKRKRRGQYKYAVGAKPGQRVANAATFIANVMSVMNTSNTDGYRVNLQEGGIALTA